MKNQKKIGIWMDHHLAYIMKYKNKRIKSNIIVSLSGGKKQNFGKDESLTHNTEQNQLSDYFKQLRNLLKGYPEVLLFGPTDAKTELYNVLMKYNHFKNTKIEIVTTDNLTKNQMYAFVKEHFEKI